MSDVLGRVEHFKCKAVQELSLGQEATDRLKSPASPRLQELGNIFQLGDLGVPEADFLLELLNSPVELLTCVSLKQFG